MALVTLEAVSRSAQTAFKNERCGVRESVPAMEAGCCKRWIPPVPGLEGARFMPQVLSPLITAAERGKPLEPAVSALVRVLGFDSFMYGTGVSDRPNSEQKSYVFTTLPRAWVIRYQQRAYIEVDPRIQHVFDSAMPFIWDQRSERGKSAAIDVFLDDAAAKVSPVV